MWRRGEIDWDGNPIPQPDEGSTDEKSSLDHPLMQKCMIVLNKMEDLPAMMTITKIFASTPRPPPSPPTSSKDSTVNVLKIHCLRLIELTQRTSAVMKVSERHFDRFDPVINVFRTFGKLNEVLVTAKMAIVPDNSFADTVHHQAQNAKVEMVIVPWTGHGVPVTSGASIPQDEFIKQVLEKLESHVAVMIDTNLHTDDELPSEPSLSRSISMMSLRNRAMSMTSASAEIEPTPIVQLPDGYHVFLPYFGGRDDFVALTLVVQLLRGADVKATIVRIQCGDKDPEITSPAPVHVDETKDTKNAAESIEREKHSSIANVVSKMVKFPASLDNHPREQNNVIDQNEDDHHVTHLLNSIPGEIKARLTVERIVTSTPLQYAVKRAKRNIDSNSLKHHLIIVGRGAKFPRHDEIASSLRQDLGKVVPGQSSEMIGKSCLGDVGEAMFLGYVTGGLLVVQSGKDEDE